MFPWLKRIFTSNKKHVIKVQSAERTGTATILIQNGYFFLCSSNKLFSHPFDMFAGAVLSHHGIELILKACWVWDKKEYSYTHNLSIIANQISFLRANKEIQDLITKIDTYYHCFRYPLENNVRSKVQKQLDRINDNTLGIPTSAGEIGTDEWEKVEHVYNFIVDAMPSDLHELWKSIISQYSQQKTK